MNCFTDGFDVITTVFDDGITSVFDVITTVFDGITSLKPRLNHGFNNGYFTSIVTLQWSLNQGAR